ncbi:MAG: Fe-S oxidoreductase, partial [bacterium]
DGNLLTPELSKILKKARYRNPRIAWDGPITGHKKIRNQLDMLISAGYFARSMCVFMIYNYNIDYGEMLEKVQYCRKWGVQVADCRYRPLDQTFEDYRPLKKQTGEDYYIHPNWTDAQIKAFRKTVREQNIMIRYNFKEYSVYEEAQGRARREARKLAISN